LAGGYPLFLLLVNESEAELMEPPLFASELTSELTRVLGRCPDEVGHWAFTRKAKSFGGRL